MSRADVIEKTKKDDAVVEPRRRRAALGALAAVAVVTVALLTFTNSLPHASALADEGSAPTCSAGSVSLTQDEARAVAEASYPDADVAELRSITSDTLALVTSGDAAGAAARATDLETAWDDRQDALNAADCQAWTFIDKQIDPVLSAVRAKSPDSATERTALQALLTTLGGA